MSAMVPERLRQSDTIGLISPSSIADPEKYSRIQTVIEGLGYKVKPGANLFKSEYGYSASERERADDFNAMILDDEVKIVLFGGGECGNEILPLIDYDAIRRHPKILSSYSDGTNILLAARSMTGLITYYGQTPGVFDDLRYYDYLQFTSHFTGQYEGEFIKSSKWKGLSGGAAEGELIGGYGLIFALLLGSKYFTYDRKKEYILFLEDHERYAIPGAVGEYLAFIEQNEFFRNVRGLLFGHYSVNESQELNERLARFGEKNRIPVVYCDDFGHGNNHAILPIGVRARLDAGVPDMVFLP
jgi:muramoyltetrapeptide carboxypeptidase